MFELSGGLPQSVCQWREDFSHLIEGVVGTRNMLTRYRSNLEIFLSPDMPDQGDDFQPEEPEQPERLGEC